MVDDSFDENDIDKLIERQLLGLDLQPTILFAHIQETSNARHNWITTQVSMNDSLSDQRKSPNPWRTLARYQTSTTTDLPADGSSTPINRLPVDVFYMVVDMLPQESAACLALTSRAMLRTLGTQYFTMDKASKWKLLLILEPEYQNCFACPVCLMLHHASARGNTPQYKCLKDRSTISSTALRTMTFPLSLTYGVAKMIGRKIFEGERACLEYLSFAAISEKKTTRHIKYVSHVTPRLVDGNLILRTETFIHPFNSKGSTYRSLAEMFTALEISPRTPCLTKAADICQHTTWMDSLRIPDQFWEVMNQNPADCGGSFFRCRHSLNPRLRHRAKCYDHTKVADADVLPSLLKCLLRHSQPCAESCEATCEVLGCEKCFTDYSISGCDVPSVGRCIVLTTWKDFGGVSSGAHRQWSTHYKSYLYGRGDERPTIREVGDIYKAWLSRQDGASGTEESDEGQRLYAPRPDRKVVRDLTRRTKRVTWFGRDQAPDETTDDQAETDSD